MSGPNGILVVDKPAGMTSHDVVARVRRILGTKKVGHAGTLDPDATGILVLGVGTATRLLSFAQDGVKRYRALCAFGASTTSQDASGEVIERRPVTHDRAALERVVASFVGEIEQIPPMVSAVKIDGERLYKKARRGEVVDRPPRKVTIHSAAVTSYEDDPPEVTLDVACSQGTYIRTLVHDIGETLGCGAHLKALRRVESSGFREEDAVSLEDAGPGDLRPVGEVVRSLPQVAVDDEGRRLVADGRPLPLDVDGVTDGSQVAIASDGSLVAIYKRRGDVLVADKVLPS